MVDNMNERPSLYYNKSAVGNRISLQLIGLKSNQAALGAVVTLQQGNERREGSAQWRRATSHTATCNYFSA